MFVFEDGQVIQSNELSELLAPNHKLVNYLENCGVLTFNNFILGVF